MEHHYLSGRRFGAIPEWETRLAVDGDGVGTLFRRRGPGDSAQVPPGRFSGKIPEPSLRAFVEALEGSGIQNYASETPDPRDPINLLDVCLNGKVFRFNWGRAKPPVPPPIIALKQALARLAEEACASPVWSLSLSVESCRSQNGSLEARLQLLNQGSASIHIVHPASVGLGPAYGLHLRYGEAQSIEEGVTPSPIDVKIASYREPFSGATRLISLKPGRPYALDFSAPLEGSAPRGWVAKFAFPHYLPEDSLAGIPVFNGALFTEEFSW